ncbi:flagellar basal-body MS-ring/collar protein FliF [Oceanobacillus damuensis]|uniref:flagellar basal-body MS-ring/collar protein FliF n=1 Tax=Oceanobacillus damuensis TaxID=937928 RepID=UPI000830CCC6|nr:flagellar basal-body MS-ring/collar protein FliF [Oceanobacillus damuensis]
MKENLLKWKETATAYWTSRSKSQKGIFLGTIIIVVLLIAVLSVINTNKQYVPLYNNLSLQEVGQIKGELDARGVPYELNDGGTTITVPEEQVETLLVDLAGMGLPNSGNIDYSFFSENTSWGITDNEFNIMKLDAMQTELANLIQSIDGIEDAQVMINMPEDPVFVSETIGEASASIVLNTQPGYQFQGNQVDTLYHLVSKAVPNLSPDNIVIMNQYFEYFDRNSQTASGAQDAYTYQQTVKKDIERDIQRRLQQMLGTMVGADNVLVSVTADIDFTQENRTEELVEPVDIENMEGLPVSLETIQESYSGDAGGGLVGTGEEDVTNYPAGATGEGDYELDKETINYEFNRIRKEIVESPYKVRDLGIQVAVDNVTNSDGNNVEFLTQQEQIAVEDGFYSILDSIVGTTIDAGYGEIDPEEKISIVFQEFTESPAMMEVSPVIPAWMYIAGAVLLIIIIVLIILLVRNRSTEEEMLEEMETVAGPVLTEVPEIPEEEESESVLRRKQLEKIAKDKPEDFAKLLRSWIGED